MEANQADMKLVADLATKSVTPTVIKDEREHFIVLPDGAEIRSLREFQYAEPPLKKAGKVTAEDVPSFAAYFQRFRDQDSMIFGLPEKFTFTGILDYHVAKDGPAREKGHQVVLELRQTARWKAWKGNNKSTQTQEQFAQFIEDNLPDIYAPDGTDYPPAAVMLAMASVRPDVWAMVSAVLVPAVALFVVKNRTVTGGLVAVTPLNARR